MALLGSPISALNKFTHWGTLIHDEAEETAPVSRVKPLLLLKDVPASPSTNFPCFIPENVSLLKRVLTEDMFTRLLPLRTPSGFTIHDVISSGLENQDSKVGIYAGDVESYSVFKELFDPVIAAYQGDFAGPSSKHICDFDGRKLLNNPDPEGRYILSVRARVARNITGFPFSPNLQRPDRLEVERIVRAALQTTSLAGRYWSLCGMSGAERQMLIDQHLLFNGVDRFQRSAGILRDWPSARGMYQTEANNLLVWVNEQDHLRIISMQPGNDMIAVFHRLVEGIHTLGSALEAMGYPFVYDAQRGYMGSEPSQLGTGLRASVLIRLPHLHAHPQFKTICQRMGLGIRGTNGEHTPVVDGVMDISNRQRLGRSEVELVQQVIDGAQELIRLEQRLERGETL